MLLSIFWQSKTDSKFLIQLLAEIPGAPCLLAASKRQDGEMSPPEMGQDESHAMSSTMSSRLQPTVHDALSSGW